MTAVASASSFQQLPRNGWPNGNGTQTMNGMSPEEVSRMFLPRQSAQRSHSSSSLSSQASPSSTVPASPAQSNNNPNGDVSWGARKKPGRGLWPATKAEPVSGLSTARPQPVPAGSLGPSATSAISALHKTPSLYPSQQMVHSQLQQNGTMRGHAQPDSPAILHLVPMNGTFDRKTISVPYSPDILRVGRQTNTKTLPSALNAYFDSKVLSRQHAEIWAERDGKIWIRDVKSSNGTFVNGKRLSPENKDSEPHPLKEQDVLELGIDIVSEDQKTVVHHKVAARVEHAGIYGLGNNAVDLNFGDLDASSVNGLMAQPMSQNTRVRPGSQASNTNNNRLGNNGNGSANNNMAVVAYHAKWLQPVTMEQIVKRLHAELKQARLQSQDLTYTSNFVEAVVTNEKPPQPQPQKVSSPTKSMDSIKSRFASSPPAPPPQQPLPEKPDLFTRAKLHDLQPLLRRSDTAKQPTLALGNSNDGSPTKSDASSQIINLVEALSTAQRELSNQSDKLKEMEDALKREREARDAAEEKVVRLEGASSSGLDLNAEDVANPQGNETEDDRDRPSIMQRRLDIMRAEMADMKVQMERYRRRAETAEEEGHRDRQSLADMVEAIRWKDDTAMRRQVERKRKQSSGMLTTTRQAYMDDQVDIDELDVVDDNDDDDEFGADLDGLLTRGANGHYAVKPQLLLDWRTSSLAEVSADELLQLSKAVSAALGRKATPASGERNRTQEQLVQSAPYASILGVVLLGVGMMAYLNGWQKGVVDR